MCSTLAVETEWETQEMTMDRSRRRAWGRALAAVALSSTALGFVGLAPASAAKAKAQAVPVGEANYSGYGSGAVTHLSVLNGEAAFTQTAIANGAVASKGLAEVKNELARLVQPGTAGKNSGANGHAIAAELLGEPVDLVDTAVAEAAPSTALADVSLAQVPVSTAAYAQLLNGQAQARWAPNDCVLGADLSFSRGQAAAAQLIGAAANPDGSLQTPMVATQDPTAERSVVWSQTRQRLVAQTDRTGKVLGGDLGLLTEVRQTLKPVTIRLSNEVVVNIEVAGTYTLRSFAGGLPGSGFVTFNPELDFQAPVFTVTVPAASPAFSLVDPIFGHTGPAGASVFVINFSDIAPITDAVAEALAAVGIADLKVAEPPRAIGDPTKPATEAADGTAAAGALDIVRFRGTDVLADTLDFRFGHAEATANVPVGGIECPGLQVAKVTDKDPVSVGDTFKYTITVTNPYDCTLTNVKLVDTISSDKGITFSIGATNPTASSVEGKTVTWNDIGPIGPHGNKAVTVDILVESAANIGRIMDNAVATADCGVGDATGKTDVKVNLRGEVTLLAPAVNMGDRARGSLPQTGGDPRLPIAGGLLLAGLAVIEAVRRKASRTTS
jgi:uncharacterized repeat protein (TIGR01451 family)